MPYRGAATEPEYQQQQQPSSAIQTTMDEGFAPAAEEPRQIKEPLTHEQVSHPFKYFKKTFHNIPPPQTLHFILKAIYALENLLNFDHI